MTPHDRTATRHTVPYANLVRTQLSVWQCERHERCDRQHIEREPLGTAGKSQPRIDTRVSDEDVFEHVINGLRVSVLLIKIRELTQGEHSEQGQRTPSFAVS